MKKLILFSVALMSVFFFSCEDGPKNARIEVWLTDEAGDYQEVNVDLQAVEVHTSETDNEQGWQSVEITPQVYNLLDYTNGKETLLGGLELPGGKLSQVRLKLGDENTVMVDDQVYDLTTPSAQQSGLKIRVNEVLGEGITYKITLDFEAGKSVVKTGNGKYILKPSIRAMTEAASGAIKGSVNPPGVVAITLMAADTVNSTTSSNEEGKFLFSGIKTAGTYKLVFDAPGDAPVVEKADVDVGIGAVTDVGVIEIGQ
ncbi:MAG: DUF4382 domain-containing protein [Cyclobacteriaceae bacterium]